MSSSSHTLQNALLAVDVANEGISLSVLCSQTGKVLSAYEEHPTRHQAERIAPDVMNVLQAADLSPDQLDRVVATTGPGGFSGVRVGLAFCRAFAFGLGIPFEGYTTLQAVAYGQKHHTPEARPHLVIFAAGRGQFYIQGFDKEAFPLTPELCLTKAHITECIEALLQSASPTLSDSQTALKDFLAASQDFVLSGSGSTDIAPLLSPYKAPHTVHPEARVHSTMLGHMSLEKTYPTHETLYLREADAIIPQKKHRPVVEG